MEKEAAGVFQNPKEVCPNKERHACGKDSEGESNVLPVACLPCHADIAHASIDDIQQYAAEEDVHRHAENAF